MHGSFGKKKCGLPEGSQTPRELVLHPMHINDLMLWTAFRSGDEKAFMTIFERFSQPMFNYAFKIAGEREYVKDSIQELFIEIWQNRERLGDTDSIKFYLFKSLRRKLLRSMAKPERKYFSRLSKDPDQQISPSHEFVLIAEQRSTEKRERVMVMLNQLTKRQHEALFLRYFEELNCEEIAAVMNVSKQAVYNLIHHALEELRKSNFPVDHFR